MKIFHTADLHLGSKMAFLERDKARKMNEELSAAFNEMVLKAQGLGVEAILLSGDLFDSDIPRRMDKEFFYKVVKNAPAVDFYYLKGNHDTKTSHVESLPNLKLFSADEWTTYDLGDVTVSGIELTAEGGRKPLPELPEKKFNIVMLHGQAVDAAAGEGETIALRQFAERNIDYLALGHIHTASSGKLDKRGCWAYSGCPEGRGFDEAGEKGWWLIDTESGAKEFVRSGHRQVVKPEIDVTGAEDMVAALAIIREKLGAESSESLVEAVVTGHVPFDASSLCTYLEQEHGRGFFYFKAKNRTIRTYSAKKYKDDPSLLGEFVRSVLSDNSLGEEMQSEVISMGLKVLNGEEVE